MKLKDMNKRVITMKVTPYEKALILEIRKHSFGRVTAIITDGIPQRLEMNQSKMITDLDDFERVLKELIDEKQKDADQNDG